MISNPPSLLSQIPYMCSLDHDDGSFKYLNAGNVVAFAGAKNYEGCVLNSQIFALMQSSPHLTPRMNRYSRFSKVDTGNLFLRPDFEGPGEEGVTSSHGSWRASPRNAYGQRTTVSGVPLPEAFYFPACYRSLGQWSWGRALADSSVNNTCILNATISPYIFGSCIPSAPGEDGRVPETANSTFMTQNSTIGIECGGKTLSLLEAQAVGYEMGSIVTSTPSIEAVIVLVHSWLSF